MRRSVPNGLNLPSVASCVSDINDIRKQVASNNCNIAGVDLLGWVVTTSVWTNLGTALSPASKAYSSLGGAGALAATYVALLIVLSAAAAALKADVKRFAVAFTAVFGLACASWIIGSYAYLSVVTPADLQRFGIGWSLKLTNEGGFIVALLAGIVIANFFPRFADWLKEASAPSSISRSRS